MSENVYYLSLARTFKACSVWNKSSRHAVVSLAVPELDFLCVLTTGE